MTTLKGTIFDIRRFSTHDGDGIRTTVFLKGCPLKCVWCQNPKGIERETSLVHFSNRCIGCGLCASISVDGDITIKDQLPVLHNSQAKQWQEYVTICPTNALVMDSKQYTVAEVIEIVLRDQPFFQYGGGVTLSGGEPLLQKEFTLALLKALKQKAVHTAVETSLCVDQAYLLQILPYIDTLFADFKVFDDGAHKRATGIDNGLIKDNIAMVLTSAYCDRVIIRTPLIPQYTATKENIAAICQYIAKLYPQVTYELLNYNPLAQAKYKQVGIEYCFKENPKLFTKEEMQEFQWIAQDAGIINLLKDDE